MECVGVVVGVVVFVGGCSVGLVGVVVFVVIVYGDVVGFVVFVVDVVVDFFVVGIVGGVE